MMLPAETRDRLGKLIPRLASNHDNEVVNTVRAIERTLKAAESDFHGLAAIIIGRRTGWTPGELRRAAATRGGFNYADIFKESEPLFDGPEPPEALTRKFGLPVYAADRIEPWWVVARHCLDLNRTVPKKHGGKFLEDWEKEMLKSFADDRRPPTNRHVEWIERTIARLHQARDAAARAKP